MTDDLRKFIIENQDLFKNKDFKKLLDIARFKGYYILTELRDLFFAINFDIPKILEAVPIKYFFKSDIETYKIPINVTKIDFGAFQECKELKTIYLHDNIEYIGSSAFKDCASLEYISIPPKIKNLNSKVFENCINLKDVQLNAGLEIIADNAFGNCTNLEEIKIPNSVRSIYNEVFRSCSSLKKVKFGSALTQIDADIFCIQETKCQPGQIDLEFEGYTSYWNSAEKKGYSGTAIFTKQKPIHVQYGIGIEEHDKEGRVITLEYENFYMVNIYTPNSKRELERLDYRQIWEDEIRKYLLNLNTKKPVIMCGDLNVAHKEIDLKNPKTNRGNAGFTDEEREKMTELLSAGFIDTYRYLYPEKEGAYSWWSYMGRAREKNVGWRIDYFIVSASLKEKIKEASIYPEVMGSDHCPVGLEIF